MLNLTPFTLILRAITFLVAMAVHEFAHAYTAHLMGDDTAREQGKMTLNPFVNIYWPGFILALIGAPALLGSAPINSYRMRNPRWGTFTAVIAGPFSNLILAAMVAAPLRLDLIPRETLLRSFGGERETLFFGLYFFIFINLILFLFNLVPLFPLDGWTILLAALPPGLATVWQRYRTATFYIMFGLIAVGFVVGRLEAINPAFAYLDVLGWLVINPALQLAQLLLGG